MQALTLYEIEDELQAWANSFDLAETDEERAEIGERVSQYLQAARDKRDRFVEFLRHLDSQIELAKHEKERLFLRRRSIERMRDSLELYAIRTMECIGEKKLEGNTSTLALHRNPASVVITDEEEVPLRYKRCTITVPAEQAADVVNQFDVIDAKYTTSKTDIKAAIEAGETVPGADLVIGAHSLRMR